MMNLNQLKIGVFSKIPGIASQIVSKLPRIAAQVTDHFEKYGPISQDEMSPKTEDEKRNLASKIAGDSDILVADTDILAPVVYHLDNVKWVQSTWAGVDFLLQRMDPDRPYPHYRLTRFAGCFGQHMAEYVLGHIIARERNFKQIYKSQEGSAWDVVVQHAPYRLLNTLSICVLGVGDIGHHVAKICKDFGMTVYGFVSKEVPADKKQSFIDEYYHKVDDLPEILKQSDYVCNTLPKTQKTDGILSGGLLEKCKDRQTVLVNIGRGNIIMEDEIIHAIESDWIGGAILDVFNEEPLPKTNKLWQFPNVVITPHCSGLSLANEVAEVFVRNYLLFENGEELNHLLDWKRGY